MSTALSSPSDHLPRARRLTTQAETGLRQYLADDTYAARWPNEVSQALNACTRKQSRLAICKALGMDDVSAYTKCYDVASDRAEESIRREAVAAIQNITVSSAVQALTSWLDNRWLKDNLQVREYLLDRAYEESSTATKASDRLAATKLLASLTGNLVQRSEIIHRSGSDVDRQDDLARQLLSCIQDTLGSSQDLSVQQLTSGAQLCARCQAEIDPAPPSE